MSMLFCFNFIKFYLFKFYIFIYVLNYVYINFYYYRLYINIYKFIRYIYIFFFFKKVNIKFFKNIKKIIFNNQNYFFTIKNFVFDLKFKKVQFTEIRNYLQSYVKKYLIIRRIQFDGLRSFYSGYPKKKKILFFFRKFFFKQDYFCSKLGYIKYYRVAPVFYLLFRILWNFYFCKRFLFSVNNLDTDFMLNFRRRN